MKSRGDPSSKYLLNRDSDLISVNSRVNPLPKSILLVSNNYKTRNDIIANK